MFIETFLMKKDELFELIIQHTQLTVTALFFAIFFGVTLGVFITKNKKLANMIMGCANLVQAIPSLAILGFMIPLLGIGSTPAVCMIVLYSMLPILKNTYTAITNISPNTIESAKGIGMTSRQVLFKIKIPLAVPIIMAGIRISAVTSVGLTTVSAFIGAGGLGYFVYSGIQTVNNELILLGAIPAAILALTMDFIVGKIELAVTPNGILARDGHMIVNKKLSSKRKKLLLIVGSFFILSQLGYQMFKLYNQAPAIVIGSKNYTEQLILGNLVADYIESHTDYNVDRQLNLGGTGILFNAMNADELDVYIEYTGTMFVNILEQTVSQQTPREVYDYVSDVFEEEYDIKTLHMLGLNNTYTLAVTNEFATAFDLESISDLKAIAHNIIISPSMEFTNREDGLLGIQEKYDITFKDVLPMDGTLRYQAIDNGESQVINAFSTDGLLKAFDLVVLEDDLSVFPPYFAVPLVRNETLEQYPKLEGVLNELSGVLTDDVMRELNYQVDVLKQDPAQVATSFLIEHQLINE